MSRRRLETLVLDDDHEYATFIGDAARGDSMTRLEITHVTSLDAALAVDREPDVALVDLSLPDTPPLLATRRIRDTLGCAVVIMADESSEPAVGEFLKLGVEEYLVKEHTDAALLLKTVRFAFDRHLLVEEVARAQQAGTRERELRRMERLAAASTSVTATTFGVGPLRQRDEGVWGEVVAEYRQILRSALRERAFRVAPTATDDLTSLAQVLGFQGATPRDVVELHTEGLKAEIAASRPGLAQPLVEEGRLLVLELMGTVLTYYRGRAVRSPVAGAERAAQ